MIEDRKIKIPSFSPLLHHPILFLRETHGRIIGRDVRYSLIEFVEFLLNKINLLFKGLNGSLDLLRFREDFRAGDRILLSKARELIPPCPKSFKLLLHGNPPPVQFIHHLKIDSRRCFIMKGL